MTTTRQHIEDLDPASWAALAKRAAAVAVAAADRLEKTAPAELLAVAAMSEPDLVAHRNRSGPERKRLSAVMRLVEADHLRVLAEGHAREAQQEKKDAEAAAALARAEVQQAARDATAAREHAREVQAQAARRESERSAERAASARDFEQLRTELERVRADAAAEVAAAREQANAAEARAEERTRERTAEKATARQAFEQLRLELEQIRADAAAEVAAAGEQVSAAEARAQQRADERAAERATAQQALARLSAELEQVKADAASEVAAARGQASGEIAAAHQAAEAEVSRTRAEVAEAIQAVAQARAEVEQVRAAALAESSAPQLLAIPIPPLGASAYTGRIEHAVSVLRQIDYVLEAGLSDDPGTDTGAGRRVDLELVRNLLHTVQEQAGHLSEELRNLPSYYSAQWQVEAANTYANAAANAYGALLQRIATVTEQLRHQDENSDVVELVTAMLDEHPWRRY